MKLVVGLGNPGSGYAQTRHNVGFMAVEKLAATRQPQQWRTTFQGFVCDLLLQGEKVVVLRPMTYMNNSGSSVLAAMQFYKLPLADLLVVVDDLALPCGAIRLRASGSAGGHNGLGDIERALHKLAEAQQKTGRDYARLRIGIDAPGRVPQKSYVLEPFSAVQKPLVQEALAAAEEAIEHWVVSGIDATMTRFNVRPHTGEN